MAEFLLGKREIISFGLGSVWGTAVSPTIILKNAKISPNNDEDWQEITGIGSDSITLNKQVGNKRRGFNLTFNPQDWRMWPFIMGTSANGGSYTHTMAGTTTTPFFTLQRNISHTTPVVTHYPSCKVKSGTISWSTGKFVQMSLECIADDVTIDGTPVGTPTASSEDLFLAKHVQVVLNTNDGNTVYCLNGSITVDEALHDSMYASAASEGKISEPQPTLRTVKGNFTFHATNKSLLDLQINRVIIPGTCTVSFIRTAGTDQFVMTFTNMRLKVTAATVIDGIDVFNCDMDADSVSCVATDSIATYPTE